MTKAEEIYTRTEQLVAGGMTKADAFRQLAAEYGQPLGSIRGAYYQHSRRDESSQARGRPRRRETTAQDAVADARAALERALRSIDREVEAAEHRAAEAQAEFDALKASADERKQAITKRIEQLR